MVNIVLSCILFGLICFLAGVVYILAPNRGLIMEVLLTQGNVPAPIRKLLKEGRKIRPIKHKPKHAMTDTGVLMPFERTVRPAVKADRIILFPGIVKDPLNEEQRAILATMENCTTDNA